MNNCSRKLTCNIALAGGGGSHVGTIGSIARALSILRPGTQPRVLDLSLFDTRGRADYSGIAARLIRIEPQQVGFARIFKTAAPNLLISGGVRRFESLVHHFEDLLESESIGLLLICHAYGIPEQALIQACRRKGVVLAQIDEGPFSVLVKPKGAPTPGLPASKAMALSALKYLGLLPERDWSGSDIDVFFATSAARARGLESKSIRADRIRLASAPRFDSLANACACWRSANAGRKAAAACSRVLVLHQPFKRDGKVRPAAARHAEATLFSALRIVAQRRRIQLSVRMHPRADEAERARYRSLLASVPAETSLTGGGSFYDQLPEFDLFAGFYSSSLLEAAAAGAPVVGVSIPVKAFYRGNEGAKAASMSSLGVAMSEEPDQLAALIEMGLEAGSQNPPVALFDEQLGPLSAEGSRHVAEELLLLADAGKSVTR